LTGGGVIGCTTAYYLTRHPSFDPSIHTITLLEAAPNIASGASGKAGGLLALWAYPSCLVPLSYRLHSELAKEHDGATRWGYRKLGCGSFEAVVTKAKIEEVQKMQANGHGHLENGAKDWESLPKRDVAANELMEAGPLPKDLDWVDREIITSWAEMGAPGRSETAQVHPWHFTTSIAKLAQEKGLDLRTNAKVTDIGTSKTGVQRVTYLDRTTGDTKTLDNVTNVIVTAGPWTGKVLPRSKVEGLRAHSVVYDADVSPYAVFTDIELPSDYIPEHRLKLGQKRRHKGSVDPEIYARPFGEVYACGMSAAPFSHTEPLLTQSRLT
jgi:glycine/D-amino acid oxidase-like deaminating enzyme